MSLFQGRCWPNSSSAQSARREKCGRIIISLLWFSSSLSLAVLIPDIGRVIQMLGSLAAVFIFVFPGMKDDYIETFIRVFDQSSIFFLCRRLSSSSYPATGSFLSPTEESSLGHDSLYTYCGGRIPLRFSFDSGDPD